MIKALLIEASNALSADAWNDINLAREKIDKAIALTNKKEKQMKVIVKEEKNEGLGMLLGKRVLLMCAGYFYEGLLVGVNKTCVKLEDPSIVYSTGAWTDKNYSDIQKLHTKEWYVRKGLIESFGASKACVKND